VSFGTSGLIRLVIIAAAWAVGETIAAALGLGDLGRLVGLSLAVAAYFITDRCPPGRVGRMGRRSGPVKYWRGRPVDDSEPRRWN
jgi:hypothetical protein